VVFCARPSCRGTSGTIEVTLSVAAAVAQQWVPRFSLACASCNAPPYVVAANTGAQADGLMWCCLIQGSVCAESGVSLQYAGVCTVPVLFACLHLFKSIRFMQSVLGLRPVDSCCLRKLSGQDSLSLGEPGIRCQRLSHACFYTQIQQVIKLCRSHLTVSTIPGRYRTISLLASVRCPGTAFSHPVRSIGWQHRGHAQQQEEHSRGTPQLTSGK
jgi:hypothetical protein